MEDTNEPTDTLPAAIVARLRHADRVQAIVDPRTDRAIIGAARSHFGSRVARPARWAVPLGIAASLLLAFLLVRPFDSSREPSGDDVDGSGRVDVLDVLALARARAGDASDARIEELGYRIVALNVEGRGQ